MAKLDNFTNDEQLIIIHSITADLLLTRLAEIAGVKASDLFPECCHEVGRYIANQPLDELQQRLDRHRRNNAAGANQAREDFESFDS